MSRPPRAPAEAPALAEENLQEHGLESISEGSYPETSNRTHQF